MIDTMSLRSLALLLLYHERAKMTLAFPVLAFSSLDIVDSCGWRIQQSRLDCPYQLFEADRIELFHSHYKLAIMTN